MLISCFRVCKREWITNKLGFTTCFTDTYCLWQSGTAENTNNLEGYIYSKGITLAAPKPCTGSTLSSELSATHLPLYGWASCLQRHGTGRRNGRICGQKAVMRQYALRSIRTEPNWFRSALRTIPWFNRPYPLS